MAVIAVPRELRDVLGDAASESLVDLLRHVGGEQREDLIAVVEERFARRVMEARDELRSEMHTGFMDLQQQIGGLRAELHQEIGNVHREIGQVRKEIAVQTRWLVTVMVAAAVLIPVMQKVLAVVIP